MAFNLLQQMEMLEDMILNGVSATSVVSIGWAGVGSVSGGSGTGGNDASEEGNLSDEEFEELFTMTYVNLFASIYSMLGGDMADAGNGDDLAALIFDALNSSLGIGGGGSNGTDGGIGSRQAPEDVVLCQLERSTRLVWSEPGG
jgi:hypothetical protein